MEELCAVCRDISEQESEPVLSPLPSITSSSHWWRKSPFPVCQIQPCHVPILCFCHPSAPLLLTAVPPSCSPCTQLLSCSALGLPNPGLARWATDAQNLWGFLLHPVQLLSLLLCCRMAPFLWTSLPHDVSAGQRVAGP